MDLSKIPTEDLQAIQEGRWKDVSTPGLQEYQSQRQHQAQAQVQAQNPQQIPDSADKVAQGNKPRAKSISLNGPGSANGMLRDITGQDPEKVWGQAVGSALLGATPGINKLMPYLNGSGAGPTAARIATNGAVGAAQGAINSPQDRLGGAETGALVGGGLGAGSEALQGATRRLGDYLMQRGVGMRRYTPGVGTSLADQGIWGTAGRAENQVEAKLPGAEQAVQDTVNGLQGSIDSQPIADAILDKGGKFKMPGGQPGPGMEQYLEKVSAAAEPFQSQGEGGELSPQDLLSLKRQGDWEGYTNSGNPATSLDSELGRAQANKSREMLNDLSGGKTQDVLGREQALILAKKSLERPEAIHQGNGSSLFFGKYPGKTLLETSLGQLGTKTSQALDAGTPQLSRQVLQGLFNQ